MQKPPKSALNRQAMYSIGRTVFNSEIPNMVFCDGGKGWGIRVPKFIKL